MPVASTAISVLLAALLAWSAIRKLSHREEVVRGYVRAGVPEDKLNHLAMILLAGAACLILGLVWAPIGVAATIGVVCYFLIAIVFHVRARDTRNVPMPLTYAVIAAVALVLRLAAL